MTSSVLLEKYQENINANGLPYLQDAVYNKFFEVNDKRFNIEDDIWDFTFISGLHESYFYIFRFDTINDPEVKLVTKLWAVHKILGNTIKMTTLYNQLKTIKQFVAYMEKNHSLSVLMPTQKEIAEFFDNKKIKYTYEIQLKSDLINFYNFLQYALNIPQNPYAIEYLELIDIKLKKLDKEASKRKPIEDEYYCNLLEVCQKVMRGSEYENNHRIISATIILLSQTGIRNSELQSIQNEVIHIEKAVTSHNVAVSKEYIWAYSTKYKSVKDDSFVPIKIPLTKLAKEAYLFLQSFCEPFRKSNQLIAFDGYVFREYSIGTLFKWFLLDFHEEIDCLDTWEKYPNLQMKKISDIMADETFREREYRNKYGNHYLIYPVIHQFRHTYINLLHRNGFTLPQIYRLANHSSINTTIQHYCEPNIDVSNKSRGELSFLYKGKIVNNPTSLMTKEIIKFAKEYGISYEGVIQDETQDNS